MAYRVNLSPTINSPDYNQQALSVFDNAWTAWCVNSSGADRYNVKAWQKKFNCRVIVVKESNTLPSQERWIALEFKNKAAYMIFLLEWS
jgi:hypothetical protein